MKSSTFSISREVEFFVLSERTEVLQLELKLQQKQITKLWAETKERGAEIEQNATNMKQLGQSTGKQLGEFKKQIEEMKHLESKVLCLCLYCHLYQFKIYVANEYTVTRNERHSTVSVVPLSFV